MVMLTILMISLCASVAHPVSSAAVQPAETPTKLTLYPATNVTHNSAVLTWMPYNDSNFSQYEVRRASFSGNYGCSCTVIATIYSWNETSVVAGGMTGNLTYYFIVRVYNTEGYSDSNEISVTTLPDTLDITPPTITITSPRNITYGSESVEIEWETSEPTAWIGYSLDGAQPIDLTETIMLNDLSAGTHMLTLYANDSQMNMGSATVYFTVSLDSTPPTIYHESPGRADEGSQITIFAQIMDDKGVTNTAVFYRIVGESTFTQLDMLKCPECYDTYNATITAPMGNDTLIEYYIYASDGSNSATSPSDAPATLYNITINARPPPVQIISPINATKDSALLTWTPSTVVDFQMYSIYISQGSSQGAVIANITSRQTSSYLTSGLSANTTYYFSIRVYDAGGLFRDSSEVAVTTLTDNQTQPNPYPGTDALSWLSQYGLYAAIGAIAVAAVAIAAVTLMRGKR